MNLNYYIKHRVNPQLSNEFKTRQKNRLFIKYQSVTYFPIFPILIALIPRSHHILPIVMGAHPDDYARAAPYRSYIHVDDFASPKALADYLHLLDQNPDLYNEYFK